MDMHEEPIRPTQVLDPQDIERNKDIAALGYVWVLSVIVYFTRRDSAFVRFHSKQGIVLFILTLLGWQVAVVGRLFVLFIFILCALGFLAAAQGQWKRIPLIADIAEGHWSGLRQGWKDLLAMILGAWIAIKRFFNIIKRKSPPSPPHS